MQIWPKKQKGPILHEPYSSCRDSRGRTYPRCGGSYTIDPLMLAIYLASFYNRDRAVMSHLRKPLNLAAHFVRMA
jgi:hypothetical protein